MTSLTPLTTSNTEMADNIKKITGENWQLQQQLNSFQQKLSPEDTHDTGRRQPEVEQDKKLCPNFKQEVCHNLDDCFELTKNVARRPS